jgi:hypothetical protein
MGYNCQHSSKGGRWRSGGQLSACVGTHRGSEDRESRRHVHGNIKNPDFAKRKIASESGSSDTELIRTIDLKRGARRFNLNFKKKGARFPPSNKYGTR